MNAILPEAIVLPASRNHRALPADPTNADEFEGDLEKYEHLEELAELFFAAKRHYPDVPVPAGAREP